jgi:hypothetical protein
VKTVTQKNSMTGDRILPLFLDAADAFDIDDFHTLKKAESFITGLSQ